MGTGMYVCVCVVPLSESNLKCHTRSGYLDYGHPRDHCSAARSPFDENINSSDTSESVNGSWKNPDIWTILREGALDGETRKNIVAVAETRAGEFSLRQQPAVHTARPYFAHPGQNGDFFLRLAKILPNRPHQYRAFHLTTRRAATRSRMFALTARKLQKSVN